MKIHDETGVVIREIAPDELTSVALLWGRMMYELHPDYNFKPDWWLVQIEDLLQTDQYKIFVVVSGSGEIVGFADVLSSMNPMRGWLEIVCQFVYIAPDFRHNGVFKLLLETFKEYGKELGASNFVGLTYEDNKKFWEHIGFKMTSYNMEMDL